MEIRHIFATNVVKARRAKGLSQEALAWEAGIARSYMAKIEGGQTSTGLDIVSKLAAVLEIEPAELLRPQAKRRR